MKKQNLKTRLFAIGCTAALLISSFPADLFPSAVFSTAIEAYAEEAEISVTLPYQAVTAGEELSYTLTGIDSADVTETKWYVGSALAAQAKGVCSYTVKAEDEENFISFQVTTKNNGEFSGQVYFSALPVLYIDSESSYDSFQKKTEDYTSTTMNLVADGFKSSQLYSGSAGIRLRGNSTAGLSKKPFKVKLDTKTDLLGMGKNKHWVLLANAIDSTNMRNKLLYDFSGDIGAETYMQSENVTMIYNGEYMGVYQLCEQVRVGDNRVEIYNWEDTAEDVADAFLKELQAEKLISKNTRKEITSAVEDELKADYCWLSDSHTFTSPTIAALNIGLSETVDLSDYVNFEDLDLPEATGGALVEMDFYTGSSAELLTAYKQPYYFDTPENGSTFTELYDYMKEYIQTIEYALHDTDFTYNNSDTHYQNTGEGQYDQWRYKRINTSYSVAAAFTSQYENVHYSQLLDMDSAVINFLVCEFSRNWDSMKNSAYMYKDIDGKLIMGPAWDFDWAWGNSMYNIDTDFPTGWQTTDEYFANEQYYQTVQWNRYLIKDPYFLERVYEKYQEIRPTVIEDMIKDGGLIDTYYEKYKNASLANDAKWGGSMGTYSGAAYDTEVARMKSFITKRVAWLDEQFASLDTLRTSLGGYVTSSRIAVDSVDTDSKAGYTIITASTTESTAAKISFQINGTYLVTADVSNGKTTIEVPDSVLTETIGQKNVIQVRAVKSDGSYVKKTDGSVTGEYTNAVSDYAVFYKEVKLVLNDDSSYVLTENETEDNLLSAVALNTTVSSIASNFENVSVVITDKNGNVITDSDTPVKTGWKIQLLSGLNVTDEAVIAVTGDVDGDGIINVLDMEEIQKSLLHIQPLSGAYLQAAKGFLGSDTLTVLDMEAIQKYILKIF